jgi:hypothetical protein
VFTFTYTFTGHQRVENRLRKGAASMPKTIDQVMQPWTQGVRGKLRATAYPPRRPGQKYVRTGRLANSWSAQRAGPGKWTISNKAKGKRGQNYAVFVIGDKSGGGQAWMHKGRWWRARDVIEKEVPALRQQLRAAVIKAFDE